MKKTWFSQKLSNLELCCLLTVYRAFQRTSKICHLGCWRQDAKTRFYGKLSNLERWCQLTTYRKSCNWAFQRTHYWIPKIQDGWDPPSWKSTWGHFFLPRVVRFGWNFETGAEWHVDCGDVVENETRCRILIWRTFGQIQWHVIPEPPATLQGAATGQIQWHVIPNPRITLQGAPTWWIHCRDSRVTCHIAWWSHLAKSMSWSWHIAGCKNSIRHIESRFPPKFILFLFLMQFKLWRVAAFVSSPIHLFNVGCVMCRWQKHATGVKIALSPNLFFWHYFHKCQQIARKFCTQIARDTNFEWSHCRGGLWPKE